MDIPVYAQVNQFSDIFLHTMLFYPKSENLSSLFGDFFVKNFTIYILRSSVFLFVITFDKK